MKTLKQIKRLSKKYWSKQPYNEDAYVIGYNQCQKDIIDKKYTHEDMSYVICRGFLSGLFYSKNLGESYSEKLGNKIIKEYVLKKEKLINEETEE